MRFAIWTAVSTAEQAKDDKASLPEQEKKCRAVATAKGWVEAAGPFIVPGESRTRWLELSQAENEIPALRATLEAAKQGRYDVLVIYDYNRLRDLLDPVAKVLASHGVQIYSVNQPVEPLPPQEFHPYASDSEFIMRGMAQIISRWQIADMRRKYRFGITARVLKGLYGIRVPYGYAKPMGRETDSKAVPVQVPAQARIVIEIKNLYLRGVSMAGIVRHLNDKGYAPPRGVRWHRSGVRMILFNPFYAGKVFFGRFKVKRHRYSNNQQSEPNPNPLMVDGLHQPLYSWEDYQAILGEQERRKSLPYTSRMAFSSILVCSVCGRRLYYNNGAWRCKYPGTDHIGLKQVEANFIVSSALQKALRNFTPETHLPQPLDNRAIIADLERRKIRIQEAYEAGVYSLQQAEEKIRAIERQMAELRDEEANQIREQVKQKRHVEMIEETKKILDKLPKWIKSADPRTVNNVLVHLCEIVVAPDRTAEVRFKQL